MKLKQPCLRNASLVIEEDVDAIFDDKMLAEICSLDGDYSFFTPESVYS
jgi:hypothetical protein